MLRRVSYLYILLCIVIIFSSTPYLEKQKNVQLEKIQYSYVFPSNLAKIFASDFVGLIADFQLLATINFIGKKAQNNETLSDQDWNHFVKKINSVVDLDPKFYDPYYFSGALLSWRAGKFDDALHILEKGLHARENDFHIPFVMAFIHFYFKGEQLEASKLLQIAANRPGAPKAFFTKLSARLAYYSGDQRFGISFINVMLKNEKNPVIIEMYKKRKLALENSLLIENVVEFYKEKYGVLPKDVDQLISEQFLQKIPIEPYGGEWIILENGRVYTTSQFTEQNNN